MLLLLIGFPLLSVLVEAIKLLVSVLYSRFTILSRCSPLNFGRLIDFKLLFIRRLLLLSFTLLTTDDDDAEVVAVPWIEIF